MGHNNYACDYLIIGAGIVGVTVSLELKKRYPNSRIVLLEKERALGMHSSGRNSGVLHSGIYYPPGTLKARLCREGATEMANFHRENKLRLRECGKVLVVANPQDDPQLDLLAERARQQSISVEILDERQLSALEPEARSTTGRAIFVPSTAVGDPLAVMGVLKDQLVAEGVKIIYSSNIASVDAKNGHIRLRTDETIHYGHAVNTAGLHADCVAHQFGCGTRYTLLPFKGIYWKLNPDSGIRFNHLVYPVPDLRVPFLGVHTTTTVDGSTYLGPTAVPSFGRENYQGMQGVNVTEATQISLILIKQFIANRDGFRRLAWQEGPRYFKHWFAEAAQAIAPNINSKYLMPTNKVGIRAQMFDMQEGKLVNDFLVEKGPKSTHILNAISPAWTSAFPFARYVCDQFIH